MSESAAVTQQTPDEPESKRRIVVEAQVRLLLRNQRPTIKVSAEFLQTLDYRVKLLIQDAAERCGANRRRTLKPQDL